MTTNYGAASLVAKLGSSKNTRIQTLYGNGSLLKPNSKNAVRLENCGFLTEIHLSDVITLRSVFIILGHNLH